MLWQNFSCACWQITFAVAWCTFAVAQRKPRILFYCSVNSHCVSVHALCPAVWVFWIMHLVECCCTMPGFDTVVVNVAFHFYVVVILFSLLRSVLCCASIFLKDWSRTRISFSYLGCFVCSQFDSKTSLPDWLPFHIVQEDVKYILHDFIVSHFYSRHNPNFQKKTKIPHAVVNMVTVLQREILIWVVIMRAISLDCAKRNWATDLCQLEYLSIAEAELLSSSVLYSFQGRRWQWWTDDDIALRVKVTLAWPIGNFSWVDI